MWQPKNLLPFVGAECLNMLRGLPFKLDQYLALVDWASRHLAPKKRGATSQNTLPILERLGISAKYGLYYNWNFESRFKSLMGSAEAVRQACIQLNKRWVHGIGNCKDFHSATPY
ncbi:hypothetical protein BTJ40_05720 [Microbulbifer sp. A4B17]|nr:hypothetical protein BTJ40_05720 [Microbulbifer sp. A4B17]